MTTIHDILDPKELLRMTEEKRIQRQTHPTLPLHVLNYTNRAQFAGEWTNAERVCRGLIVDFGGEIIARGPSKFFNFGQSGAPEVKMDDWVRITRKEDGSLGIGWEYEGHYGVATRGSFTSEQAIHATELLSADDKANIDWAKERGMSRIWEIVYPDNHIVLHYGNRDELIPIGTVNNETGLIQYRPNSVVQVFGGKTDLTLAEAIALPIPDDEEGYVLDLISGSGMSLGHIKLKGDRYKELHAATFQLSERKIWEAMGRGEDMEKFVSDLPDEIMPWAQGVVDRIRGEADELFRDVELCWVLTNLSFGVGLGEIEDIKEVPRGDVARYIISNYPEIKGPLFSLLDNKIDAVEEWAHKQVRPEHKLFRVENEDAN